MAGDEVNESKDRELPTLRCVFAKRPLTGTESFGSENANDKMPSVQRSQSLERWVSGYTFRKVAALSLPRLCLSVFYSVKMFYVFSFFSNSLKKALLKRQLFEFVGKPVFLGAQGSMRSFNDSYWSLPVLVLTVFVSWPTRTRRLKQQEL